MGQCAGKLDHPACNGCEVAGNDERMNTDVDIVKDVQFLGKMSVFLSSMDDEDEVLISVLRGWQGNDNMHGLAS